MLTAEKTTRESTSPSFARRSETTYFSSTTARFRVGNMSRLATLRMWESVLDRF
jgi:hypothetical protein